MVEFVYMCKHLSGSQPTRGQESGAASCAKHREPGGYCTVDTAEQTAGATKECPLAEFIKIVSFRKKK